MKKAISLLLAFVMCLTLCACGKSKSVKNVENLIDAIGEITAESGDAITVAESAYNDLTDDEKSKVENYTQLETYKVEYEEYMKSAVEDVVDDLDYYSYNQRNSKGALLNAYYDYMTDEQKKECLALYLFYMEAPDYVEKTIKNSLKNPSSYTLYDMEVESVITYDDEEDTFTGWIDITYGGTNSFGGMVKESADVWVDFTVNIKTKSISFEDITIWDF